MVTSCSVAEDNLSLSVVLSLLCLFLNPPCLLLTLPAALLAYMVGTGGWCRDRAMRVDGGRADGWVMVLMMVRDGG